ncbi:glycosyltransferase family 2 protein [Metabacillus schmidteae]|uniref:glycosyltransferase family 2 protein n=1 Tax=Metabacillus schmidteae TaxID=2730405 RepID=UPI00158A6F09|nr:glycosyltransferase family 2 protein [Metabacillus schmidteae]
MELVSIIVPIYNSERFIDKTITSIVNQTYKNIEIILLDDGSTDNSLNIMKKYEKQDGRIKVFSHKNQGQSFTRNKGIEISSGEFLVFVDSDDWLDKHFVEKMYTEISKTNSEIIVCDYYIHYSNKLKEMAYNYSKDIVGEEAFELMLNGNISHTCWGKIFKSTLIKNSNVLFPVGKTNEDLYTVSVWFLRASKVGFLNEFLITQRHREGSITNSFTNSFIDLLYILNLLRDYLVENNLFNRFEKQYKRKYQKMVVYLLNYGVRMKRFDFTKKVLKESKIPIKDFDLNLLNRREKIAVTLTKINIKLYFIFTRFYYMYYAKNIFIKK